MRLFLVLSSAVLLVFSFPNFNQPWCAWIALVPWLVLLRDLSASHGRVLPLAPHSRPRRDALSAPSPAGGAGAPLASPAHSFWWSYAIGLIFFLASMWWLVYVTVVGWLVLCAYLALYFGLFGWGGRSILSWDRGHGTRDLSPVSHLLSQSLFLSALWVSLEYARSHLLSGLGWNLLAYSQTSWLPVIQLADVTGAWGVSFLIVLINVLVAELTQTIMSRRRQATSDKRQGRTQKNSRVSVAFPASVGVGAVLLSLSYGTWRLQHLAVGPSVRVAVVQGNIPQEAKWDEAYQAEILSRYERLTQDAAKTQPTLIVWPETSTPDYLDVDESVTQRLLALSPSTGIPLLVGAPMKHLHGVVFASTNSAALLTPDGLITQRYDKLHLVPFGEFVPFEEIFPWLREVLPPIGNFVPGREYTIFRLGSGLRAEGSGQRLGSEPRAPSPELQFSVLICFEDVFPELARRFIQEGARLLLVITNDAWFGPTAAAYQHVQGSTFRAVELRVPVARAANTGWSGCIDPSGRWIGAVHDAHGAELFVSGTHTCDLPLGDSSTTVYRRFGDWFAWGCLMATLGGLLPAIISVWYSRRSARGA